MLRSKITIISLEDSGDWWGGRDMVLMLPRLFFQHFSDTSILIQEDGETAGFIVGFISQTQLQTAYVHFVGVNPVFRKQGIGRELYHVFADRVSHYGVDKITCITSPINNNSIAFHQKIGFTIKPGDSMFEGIPVHTDYDGLGQARVVFEKHL